MSPTGAATRDRLLDEAERLFARSSVDAVTTRQIVEAAGQRNTSAISYHFGSRAGLLRALLARRGGPVDLERGRRRAELAASPDVSDLVACLVVPYVDLLGDEGGRAYLQVVAQLRGRFAAWRGESDAATTVHLTAILGELEAHAPQPPAVQAERIVAMIVALTGSTAERARRIDDGSARGLAHDAYVDDLVRVCAAVIVA